MLIGRAPHPLAHQTFSFAVKALGILVLEARNPDDGADLGGSPRS